MDEQQELLGALAGRRIYVADIARILGVSRKTAHKRLTDGLTADDVITICRAVEVNPVEALVEMKFVTINEAMDYVDSDGELLATADEEKLFAELVDRRLTTPQLAALLAERTNKPAPAITIGTDDTVASLELKLARAERAGLTGTPPTDQERWAARKIDEMSQSEHINRESSRRGEQPDPEGPEFGA